MGVPATPAKLPVFPLPDAALTAPTQPAWVADALPKMMTLDTAACLIRADETFLHVNDAYCAKSGTKREDVIGKTLREMLDPTAYDILHPNFERALKSSQTTIFCRPWQNPAGQRYWVEFHYCPRFDSAGVIQGFLAIAYDLHDLSIDESQLFERERLLRHFSDSIGNPVLYINRQFAVYFANKPFLEWVGKSSEEIIGKSAVDVFRTDTYDFYRPIIARALKGETVHTEGPSRTRANIVRRVKIVVIPDLRTNGEITGVFISVTDIEDDYQLRQKLLTAEQELRAVVDNIGMPLSKSDQHLRYEYVNRVACEWFGLPEEEILGKHWHELMRPEQYAKTTEWTKRALAGEHVHYERRAMLDGKNLRQIRVSMFPNRDTNGDVIGLFVSTMDVEEDYQLKQALINRERQLQLFTDNIPEAITYFDIDRRCKFVNNAFLLQHGLARENIIGKTTEDILGADAATETDAYFERAIKGETVVYERLISNVQGHFRWFRVRIVPDFAVEGHVQGIYLIGIDIHDVKLAQETLTREKAELREAMDSLPYPMSYVDRQYRYQLVNRSLETLLGKTREELIDKDLQTVNARQFADVEPLWKYVLTGKPVTMERLITLADYSQRWMLVKYTPRHDASGNVLGLYTAAMDIDAQKRIEIELRRANWLLTSHFENTPLAMIEWDPEFRVRRWSPQAEKIFGWKESEVKGKTLGDWQFVFEEDAEQVDDVSRRIREFNEPRATSLNRNYRKDGRVIWAEWYTSSLTDDHNGIVSIFSFVQDVTTRIQAEERLVHQATHDGLTGLPNRVMLQERLQQAIARSKRSGQRVAALFIDLDRFKEVNDTLGHRVGDKLLRETATRLQSAIRESDLLVRLSGDEFMVVVEQITEIDAPNFVAAKLVNEMHRLFMIEAHEIYIACSVGISIFPDDAADAETLLKNADMAMYRAKELGKNGFQIFTTDMAERGTTMRMLENALRASLVHNELSLRYQPKVDMLDNRIIGAEALLRWQHPTRGEVLPGEFIQLAEETGLIHDIGFWVLDSALAELRRWQDRGMTSLTMAVNIAAGQFRISNLAERIKEKIDHFGVNPRSLEIEITETGLIRDPEGVGKTLYALRAQGIRVAIDDFGTGYSSLSHLKRFPIDTLKIDKSFIADLLIDPDDRAIVSAVTALAYALDINVVAEGIESELQREMLLRMGCHSYQGYLFSRPLTAEKFDELWDGQQKTAA